MAGRIFPSIHDANASVHNTMALELGRNATDACIMPDWSTSWEHKDQASRQRRWCQKKQKLNSQERASGRGRNEPHRAQSRHHPPSSILPTLTTMPAFEIKPCNCKWHVVPGATQRNPSSNHPILGPNDADRLTAEQRRASTAADTAPSTARVK